MTDDIVNYEIWVADNLAKTYPDLPDHCWAVAQRLRRLIYKDINF